MEGKKEEKEGKREREEHTARRYGLSVGPPTKKQRKKMVKNPTISKILQKSRKT